MTALAAVAMTFALGCFALAWLFGRKATEARGKAVICRELADCFRSFPTGKQERKRLWFRMLLCAPEMRDALREALADADAYWDTPFAEPALEEKEWGIGQ